MGQFLGSFSKSLLIHSKLSQLVSEEPAIASKYKLSLRRKVFKLAIATNRKNITAQKLE